mmetsp:Transcript_37045/g.85536  ORF Transcript_37045/g.85536 Transcript_37045/m.85536 type:complete len:308 (-) Transcript_37045:1947-2870(-)
MLSSKFSMEPTKESLSQLYRITRSSTLAPVDTAGCRSEALSSAHMAFVMEVGISETGTKASFPSTIPTYTPFACTVDTRPVIQRFTSNPFRSLSMPASMDRRRASNSCARQSTSIAEYIEIFPTSNGRTATRVPKLRKWSRIALVDASTGGRMCSTGKNTSSPPLSMRIMHPEGRKRIGRASSKPSSNAGLTDSTSIKGLRTEGFGFAGVSVFALALGRAPCQVRRALGADEREGCADSATSVASCTNAGAGAALWPLFWCLAGSGCSSSCSAEHGPEGPANHTSGLALQFDANSCANSSAVCSVAS